jgi:hypothetical protein
MLVGETVAVVARVTRNTQKHDVTRTQSFLSVTARGAHSYHCSNGLQELVVKSRALEHCFLESGARIPVIFEEPTYQVCFISHSVHSPAPS